MKKFLILYYTTPETYLEMGNDTDDKKAERMKVWYAWRDFAGDKLLDFGAPLYEGVRLHPDGSLHKSEKQLTGYSFIQAKDFDDAKSVLKAHPHYGYGAGCEIEVQEVMEM